MEQDEYRDAATSLLGDHEALKEHGADEAFNKIVFWALMGGFEIPVTDEELPRTPT